jgi:hypothetical protein
LQGIAQIYGQKPKSKSIVFGLLLRLVVGFTHVQSLKVQQVHPISADIQALIDTLLEKIQMPTFLPS